MHSMLIQHQGITCVLELTFVEYSFIVVKV